MARLDRRALFTSGAAAALLAATGVSLDAAPRPGGRLRLAVPRADDRFDAAVRGAVFDTLTDVGADGVLRPELAVGWDSDASARDWVLRLRPDVTFHDGAAFTADHAAAALQDLPGAQLAAADAHVLQVRLDAPNPQLPYDLADPARAITRDGLIGTGPYQMHSYRPGRHFVGHRVQPHYKDGQAGWFDAVEIVVIPDADVRAEAVRDGFVDVADLPKAATLGDLAQLRLHPDPARATLAARQSVGMPRRIGQRAPLDDGRIAQRWWMV